jgi:fluoride exporter
MQTTFWIAVGGALGSVARYWLTVAWMPYSQSLPWGTILINIIGSFAISFFGFLTMESGRFPMPEIARLFFTAGICGGFTTFSAFSMQTLVLLRDGSPGRALLNIVASVVFCLIAVSVGYLSASYLNNGARSVAQTSFDEV